MKVKSLNAPSLEDLLCGKVFFVNQLKAIMEFYGFYHDVTAGMINSLPPIFKSGVETIGGEQHPYVYDSNLPNNELGEQIKKNRESYSKFQGILTDNRYSGFFAESIIFLSLCKAYDLYGKQVGMHILQPEQSWIDGRSYKIEFPINVGGDVFGIEVKNNFMQLSPQSEKVQALLNPDLAYNPVLVNRQSTRHMKSTITSRNGRVVDLTKLLLLEHENNYVFSDLHLSHIAIFLPRIRVNQMTYNGTEFKESIKQFDIHDLIRASFQVPYEVQAKINGLIALLFLAVNFRKTMLLMKGKRAHSMCLALLLQNAYFYLLGARGEYRSIDDCFDYASSKISGVLRNHLTRNLTSIKSAFCAEMESLRAKQLVKSRLSRYRVEGLSMPENWLKLDP